MRSIFAVGFRWTVLAFGILLVSAPALASDPVRVEHAAFHEAGYAVELVGFTEEEGVSKIVFQVKNDTGLHLDFVHLEIEEWNEAGWLEAELQRDAPYGAGRRRGASFHPACPKRSRGERRLLRPAPGRGVGWARHLDAGSPGPRPLAKVRHQHLHSIL